MTNQWKCALIGWSIAVVIFELIKIGFWPIFVIALNLWVASVWVRQSEEYKLWIRQMVHKRIKEIMDAKQK